MDTERAVGGNDTAHDPVAAGEDGQRVPAWSIRRLIELVDEAIDAAGAQLARSAGLWDDPPIGTPAVEQPPLSIPRRRPVRRSAAGSSPPTAGSLTEDLTAECGPQLP